MDWSELNASAAKNLIYICIGFTSYCVDSAMFQRKQQYKMHACNVHICFCSRCKYLHRMQCYLRTSVKRSICSISMLDQVQQYFITLKIYYLCSPSFVRRGFKEMIKFRINIYRYCKLNAIVTFKFGLSTDSYYSCTIIIFFFFWTAIRNLIVPSAVVLILT